MSISTPVDITIPINTEANEVDVLPNSWIGVDWGGATMRINP